MRISFHRFALASLAAWAVGCVSDGKAPVDDQFGAAIGGKADHTSIQLVASLGYGETTSALYYQDPPRYLAVHFDGTAGDTVSARVNALDGGDPVAWLIDGAGEVHASNDDESTSSLDSLMETTLVATGPHYVLFRDYYLESGLFSVAIDGSSDDGGDWLSCNTDSDCVRVEAGCCSVGDWIGIRGDSAAAYHSSLECPANPVCPLVPILDHGETAICDNNSNTCEVVLPDEIQCGGNSINPHMCPAGYSCVGDALAWDGFGECARFCGGFGNFSCPAGYTCQDDPNDDCDPQNGGADCGGVCLGD